MSEICLQWLSSRLPQHKAQFDRAAVNAVGQVITCINESILHSPAVSSPSRLLHDNKHFTKQQPHLLAQVNYRSRRGSLPAPKQPRAYFFPSYLHLKLAALQKMSRRHPRCLLLLDKLPPFLSLLACAFALRQFPHCGSEEGSFITMRQKESKANGSFLWHHWCFRAITSALWIVKILFSVCLFVFPKNTTGNSGHSLCGIAITQFPWQLFVCLFSAAPLLLSSKCDKQYR